MINIKNLSFSYDKFKVYEDFNLFVPEGQSCLMTGINGVGKSTLLRLIAGVLAPDGGSILFDEKLGPNPKRKIGFISDKLSMYESLTVAQGIDLHKSVYEVKEFDDSLIKHTKIKYTQKIKELSLGQRTILHLSLILSAKPEILLIDEIIHSIDAYLRKVFLEQLIKLLSERSLTIIMMNLNFHDIEHMIDRVILLKDGTIAVDEEIDSLKGKVKKVITSNLPEGLPVITRSGPIDSPEFFIYPFLEEYKELVNGQVVDLNLTEIVTAFIEGEYS
ncbi:MAG: ABC transporter ATP-binding protein [Candidatus Aminicenantes bacterium]|nr:ABC transporter ATP-binding protein [Candidatus Aminicenantes bacterium]